MKAPKFKVGQVVSDERTDDMYVLILDVNQGLDCDICGQSKPHTYNVVTGNEVEDDKPESELRALTKSELGR